MRTSSRRRTGLVVVTGALVASLLTPVAFAADADPLGRLATQKERVSEVYEVTGLGAKKARAKVADSKAENQAQAKRARAEQDAAWPKAGEASVDLSDGKAAKAEPGGLPVALTPHKGAAALATVEVLSRKATEAAGVSGVLLSVSGDGKAELSLDYGEFASAYGGGWSGRLRLVELPACALTTPEKAKCRTQTPLGSSNDVGAQELSATVELTGDAGVSTQLVREASTAGATVLAATATSGESASGSGDYTATPLASSSTWSAGGSSGSFTWSYDIAVPPSAAGPKPALSLAYDSGSVDGKTASTNNQATQAGEGFGLTASYIERSYGSCEEDGQDEKYDRCWKYDNASLVLNGKSSELVKDDTSGEWRLEDDDASTVTHSTDADNGDNNGEYWTVVTGDGTKYVFGLNKLSGAGDERTDSVWTSPVFGDDSGEPCYDSTFASSYCEQAWRWNLDYVEDTHANAMSYWYTKESNSYAKNGASTATATYVRGGYLSKILYGQRSDTLFTADASGKVTFDYSERCTADDCSELTDATSDNWPDVPFDAICAADADCEENPSPSFFTRKRLTGVDTYSWSASSSAYTAVDSWKLTQAFLDGGDIGDTSDQTLVLKSLTRTGKNGDDITLDPVTFTYQMRENRVDATDDILPLTRPRIETITSETGAITDVTISEPECVRGSNMPAAEDDNSLSCYPTYWHINGADEASIDWFHKYRATAVFEADPTGQNEAVYHSYDYSGPAWHYNDDPLTPSDERTWSQWRGYRKVTAYTGSSDVTQSKTVSVYLQGMDGDKTSSGTRSVTEEGIEPSGLSVADITDSDPYSGFLREQITYNGSTPVSVAVNTPWKSRTATQHKSYADIEAYFVRNAKTATHTYLTDTSSWRTSSTETTYDDDYGMPVTVQDNGDTAVDDDQTCTRTWYARNDAVGINSLVSRTRAVGRVCSAAETDLSLPTNSDTRGDVIADKATVYDNTSATAWTESQTPTKGEASWTGRASAYPASATNGERNPTSWQTTAKSTYDTLGRSLTVTDAASNTTSTVYTPTAAGPVTRTKVTNAAGHSVYTYLDPAAGQPVKIYDVNLKKTELTYDALGRLTAVWLPNRSQAAGQGANTKFAYHVTSDEQSWVSTSTLKADGTSYDTTYTIYDALLRELQTQSPAATDGRLLTDTRYDTRGLAYETHADIYDTTSGPNGTYTRAEYGEAPSQTETVFDGAGRATKSTFLIGGVAQWSTTTSYTGDSTATTAMDGGSAARVFVDAQGRTTERRDYAGTSPTGSTYTTTKYTYTRDGLADAVTGPDSEQWSYGYDLFGRQTSATDPDSGTTTTGYTALDQTETTTDERGQKLLYAYDKIGRPTATYETSTADENKLTAYAYDTLAKGQLDSVTRYVGGTGGDAYTNAVTSYDSLYQVTESTFSLPSDNALVTSGAIASTVTFKTDYNVDGTIAWAYEPAAGGLDDEYVTTTYIDSALPKTVSGTSGYLLGASYSALGQTEQLTLGASAAANTPKAWVSNTWEEGTGRLTESHVTTNAHDYMLQDLQYGYDDAGNVLSIFDPTLLGGTSEADNQCFTYDGYRRLTEAWTPATADCATSGRTTANLDGESPYWTSYTYSDSGLRQAETEHTATGSTTQTYCYDADRLHALKATTTSGNCLTAAQEYDYNDVGATTTRPDGTATQSLTWNSESKLATLTEAGTETGYLYDADGNLLVRSNAKGESVLYLGNTEVHYNAATGDIWGQRYYTANGTAIAVRSNESGTDKVSFLAGDAHGTSTLAVAATDLAVTKRYLTPFGETREGGTGTWVDDKAFLGMTADDDTGLTHIGAREYDPTIGRFISVDPLLELEKPQTLNGYTYAAQSPLTFSDPSGLGLACGGENPACPTRPDGTPGNGRPNEAVDYSGTVHSSSDSGEVQTAEDGQPIVDGIRIPTKDELFASGFGGGYPDSATYAHMLSRWAQSKCYIQDSGVAGFCDTAGRAGLLPGTENDPWGVRASYHCITGRGDCGEAIVAVVITVVTMAWGSVGKALLARGATRTVAAEAEASAAATLLNAACSFSPETPVLLKDGQAKPIGKVELGDEVAAADPTTGKREGSREVTALLVHRDNDLVDLTIRTADGRTSTVHTTSRHPFWDDTLQAWIPAGNLEPGHALNTATDSHVTIVDVAAQAGSADMYNLTVDELHTYYVLAGRTPVLVHNAGGSKDPLSFGSGFTGRLDRINIGGTADFEVHVYRRGTEVGIFGSNGWFPKHGKSANVTVPQDVYNNLKGLAVGEMRAAGRLGAKGTENIKGDNWKRPRITGGC